MRKLLSTLLLTTSVYATAMPPSVASLLDRVGGIGTAQRFVVEITATGEQDNDWKGVHIAVTNLKEDLRLMFMMGNIWMLKKLIKK